MSRLFLASGGSGDLLVKWFRGSAGSMAPDAAAVSPRAGWHCGHYGIKTTYPCPDSEARWGLHPHRP